MRRLTYNPDFEALMTSILDFIDAAPRTSSAAPEPEARVARAPCPGWPALAILGNLCPSGFPRRLPARGRRAASEGQR